MDWYKSFYGGVSLARPEANDAANAALPSFAPPIEQPDVHLSEYGCCSHGYPMEGDGNDWEGDERGPQAGRERGVSLEGSGLVVDDGAPGEELAGDQEQDGSSDEDGSSSSSSSSDSSDEDEQAEDGDLAPPAAKDAQRARKQQRRQERLDAKTKLIASSLGIEVDILPPSFQAVGLSGLRATNDAQSEELSRVRRHHSLTSALRVVNYAELERAIAEGNGKKVRSLAVKHRWNAAPEGGTIGSFNALRAALERRPYRNAVLEALLEGCDDAACKGKVDRPCRWNFPAVLPAPEQVVLSDGRIVNLKARGTMDMAPLSWAVVAGLEEAMETLLRFEPTCLQAINSDGHNVFHILAGAGIRKSLSCLLRRVASIYKEKGEEATKLERRKRQKLKRKKQERSQKNGGSLIEDVGCDTDGMSTISDTSSSQGSPSEGSDDSDAIDLQHGPLFSRTARELADEMAVLRFSTLKALGAGDAHSNRTPLYLAAATAMTTASAESLNPVPSSATSPSSATDGALLRRQQEGESYVETVVVLLLSAAPLFPEAASSSAFRSPSAASSSSTNASLSLLSSSDSSAMAMTGVVVTSPVAAGRAADRKAALQAYLHQMRELVADGPSGSKASECTAQISAALDRIATQSKPPHQPYVPTLAPDFYQPLSIPNGFEFGHGDVAEDSCVLSSPAHSAGLSPLSSQGAEFSSGAPSLDSPPVGKVGFGDTPDMATLAAASSSSPSASSLMDSSRFHSMHAAPLLGALRAHGARAAPKPPIQIPSPVPASPVSNCSSALDSALNSSFQGLQLMSTARPEPGSSASPATTTDRKSPPPVNKKISSARLAGETTVSTRPGVAGAASSPASASASIAGRKRKYSALHVPPELAPKHYYSPPASLSPFPSMQAAAGSGNSSAASSTLTSRCVSPVPSLSLVFQSSATSASLGAMSVPSRQRAVVFRSPLGPPSSVTASPLSMGARGFGAVNSSATTLARPLAQPWSLGTEVGPGRGGEDDGEEVASVAPLLKRARLLPSSSSSDSSSHDDESAGQHLALPASASMPADDNGGDADDEDDEDDDDCDDVVPLEARARVLGILGGAAGAMPAASTTLKHIR